MGWLPNRQPAVRGLVHRLIKQPAVDPTMLAIQRARVARPQPERGVACPGSGDPDRFGQLHVPETPGEQRHRAAAFDRGELLLVPGEQHLAAVPRGLD